MLITNTGNGLGSHHYDSSSMQPTGSSHEGHESVYYDFMRGALSTPFNLNCDDLHRTPVIVSDVNSDVLYVTYDLHNVSRSIWAMQPQYGDESTQVSKSSNCYHINSTNTTNVYQNFNSNKGQVDRAADQLWGFGHNHQASRFQSLETNAMT